MRPVGAGTFLYDLDDPPVVLHAEGLGPDQAQHHPLGAGYDQAQLPPAQPGPYLGDRLVESTRGHVRVGQGRQARLVRLR